MTSTHSRHAAIEIIPTPVRSANVNVMCATNFMKWPFPFRTWQFSYLCTSHSCRRSPDPVAAHLSFLHSPPPPSSDIINKNATQTFSWRRLLDSRLSTTLLSLQASKQQHVQCAKYKKKHSRKPDRWNVWNYLATFRSGSETEAAAAAEKKRWNENEILLHSSRSFHAEHSRTNPEINCSPFVLIHCARSRANMLQLYNCYSTTSPNRKAIKNLNISKLIID